MQNGGSRIAHPHSHERRYALNFSLPFIQRPIAIRLPAGYAETPLGNP
jgi:hypothetical protein